MAFRDYWRVTLLAILVIGSSFALLAPGVSGGGSPGGATNLEYGLDLSGGTQVRAPVVGMTAEGISVPDQNVSQVERSIAADLGLKSDRVNVRRQPAVVEVYANVSESAFADALSAAGLDPATIRTGVTDETRTTIVNVLNRKISEGGLSGGTVYDARNPQDGNHYIVIEVPNANRSEVRNLVTDRGQVYISAYFPKQNASGNETAYRREVLLNRSDMQNIGTPTKTRGQWGVPVTLTPGAAQNFSGAMQRFGFTTTGVQQCDFRQNRTAANYCLLTVLDGEIVYSAGITDGLAGDIESGAFVNSPTFVITAPNFSTARQLQINLRAGSLPAPLAIGGERGTVSYISPSRAESFKLYSLLTGVFAVFAVSFVVFLRYNEASVAAPMVVTALSEVVILLGFSAAVQYTISLPVIAGFIAVIGTGVDDLIIIADEVMAEQVRSNRVFRSRFRKALWIIGAAAVTTIIAMSPLTVLSLGDLSGFAIVTILGVLVGVLVTRPAYGDILRTLLTDR